MATARGYELEDIYVSMDGEYTVIWLILFTMHEFQINHKNFGDDIIFDDVNKKNKKFKFS